MLLLLTLSGRRRCSVCRMWGLSLPSCKTCYSFCPHSLMKGHIFSSNLQSPLFSNTWLISVWLLTMTFLFLFLISYCVSLCRLTAKGGPGAAAATTEVSSELASSDTPIETGPLRQPTSSTSRCRYCSHGGYWVRVLVGHWGENHFLVCFFFFFKISLLFGFKK